MGTGPIYVGGLDRCGKTTLSAFLTSHPNIAIPAVGSNMWTYFHGQYGDLRRPANLERCLDAMLRYKHVRFLQPDVERVRRDFAAGPPTYGHLFGVVLRQYAERHGKPRWGAQTGLIERYADQLVAAHPDVRIIHMVRDPRDRYEASLAMWPGGRGRAGGAAARWAYSVDLAERHRRRHPHAYLVVRFEDLVLRTEAVVREVCDFVGEAYDPAMLSMHLAPRHRGRLSSATEGPVTLSPAFVGRGARLVPRHELAFLQLHLGRRMRAHGYEPVPVRLSRRERVRFVLVDWPDQTARLVAWRTVEALQQRLPRIVHRRPGAEMRVDPPWEAAA